MLSIALILAATAALSFAQQTETIAKPLTERQRVKKEAQLRRELQSPWHRWRDQDVAWIITDEERKAFDSLSNDEEREQFVEQFWLRRDPTPDTIENEYKEEHYRRLAYANEHFPSGIPGWKTDRGRMYIRFGPPDEIEAHPSGGTYQRTPGEGGGTTSTYPFEQWRYRHLDNVGENVVLEFVDTTMSGEYHLAFDPCEKDALSRVPGAAPTLAEQTGQSTQAARFQNTSGATCGPPVGGTSQSNDEFSRIELLANIEKAPRVQFKDLEDTLVSSHISYNTLPMQVRVDYLRITDFSTLTNVTIELENRSLSFQQKDGFEKSAVNIFGRVFTLTRRPVVTFEKPLAIAAPAELLPMYTKQKSVFQESLTLTPGKYRLTLIAKDTVSGNMSQYDVAIDVPRFDQEKLATSSLILADRIEKLPLRKTGGEMFAIGDTKVRPRVGAKFSTEERLGFYLQIYNLTSDASERNPTGRVTYQVTKSGASQPVLEVTEELNSLPNASAHQTTIEKQLSLKALDPGGYTLKVRIEDEDQVLEKQTHFILTAN